MPSISSPACRALALALVSLLFLSGSPGSAVADDVSGPAGVPAGTRFVLHSDRALNLHLFLYRWATHDADEAAGRRTWVPVAERDALDNLPAEQAATWTKAVAFYRDHLIERSLLFDDGLRDAGSRLALADSLDGSGMPAGWTEILRRAAPVYAAHWWPAHDAANRRWIEQAARVWKSVEEQVAPGLVAIYGGAWPDAPVRVDLSYYANRVGAYTGNLPSRITIASSDPDYDEWGAVEMLLHEVSHTNAVAGGYRRHLVTACEAQDVELSRELWHAVLFYTGGELTRRALAARDVEYTHYAERTGMLDRSAGTRRAYAALAPTWPAWLAVKDDGARAEAVARYVRTFAELETPAPE